MSLGSPVPARTTPVPPGCTVSAPMLIEASVTPLNTASVSVSGVNVTRDALEVPAFCGHPHSATGCAQVKMVSGRVRGVQGQRRYAPRHQAEPRRLDGRRAQGLPDSRWPGTRLPQSPEWTRAACLRSLAANPFAGVQPRRVRNRSASSTRGGRLVCCATAICLEPAVAGCAITGRPVRPANSTQSQCRQHNRPAGRA